MKQVFKDHLQAVYTGIGLVKWENGSSLKVHTDENGVCACQSM